MSKWRRTTIEKMPSCKRIIEEAKSGGQMGIDLFHELESAYKQDPPQTEVIRQILGYFLPRSKEGRNDICGDWNFFIRFPGSDALQEDLHNLRLD